MLRLACRRLAVAGKGGHINANLISRTNRLSNADSLEHGAERSRGVPRIDRQDVKKITMLHDSTDLFIAGRNKCNGFGNNQYLVGSKKAGESMIVGASDDWPDDWVAFAGEMATPIKQCFLTHCHVDDIVNLPMFWQMCPSLRVHWCASDEYWVKEFRNACIRYGRQESARATLPMHNFSLGNSNPLCSMTNRSSSFITVGEIPCYYVFTPGHSPGHMMLHLPLHRILFTGDLIFRDSVGRVDLPNACGDQMAQSLRTVEEMSDGTVLLPSHGKISTLGRERRRNPALRRLYELIMAGKQLPKVGTNSGFL